MPGARLAAGRATTKARVTYDLGPAPLRWTFAGDVRLYGLSVGEAGNEELLRWRSLELAGIDSASKPPRAALRTVRLVEPRTKVYVWEDGATSIDRALGKPPPAKGEPAKTAPAAAPAPAAGPAWKTALGLLQIERGRATFVDRSVTPTAIVNITDATAKVARLSPIPPSARTWTSSWWSRAPRRSGSPGRSTRSRRRPTRTSRSRRRASTSRRSGPYAGRFLGYGIQKGKLDLDLRYKIENRILNGANVVTLDQFTLGAKTESPDATNLPVRLALALLQDPNGVILLDVPIEGKLDDPEFKLGKVIWRTILNVLVKVATSPFSALSALAGGDTADLSLVEFEPGTARPLPDAADRFAKLAKALAQRPALGLEVEGAAGPEADGGALRAAALERALKRKKAGAMRGAPADLDAVTLGADERARLVREAYDAAFPRRGGSRASRRRRRRRWRRGSRRRRRCRPTPTARSPRSARSGRGRPCSRRGSMRRGSSSSRAGSARARRRARGPTLVRRGTLTYPARGLGAAGRPDADSRAVEGSRTRRGRASSGGAAGAGRAPRGRCGSLPRRSCSRAPSRGREGQRQPATPRRRFAGSTRRPWAPELIGWRARRRASASACAAG